ncbi:MAG: helix-turn-helix domain-containing protein [Magnetococcales bacterium]|nr:helix-turn-helix domain-containing protein [Magnetococcales bacterium]
MSAPKIETLTITQAAALIGRSQWTLRQWRSKGLGPPSRMLGGLMLVYSQADVLTWIDQHREQLDKRELPR